MAEDPDWANRLAQALVQMQPKFGATNQGPAPYADPLIANAATGFVNPQTGSSVPAYGGQLNIPNTGLTVSGNFQKVPLINAPNWGAMLRYRTQF